MNILYMSNFFLDDPDEEEEKINQLDSEIDEEVNRLLTEYDTGNKNIVGDHCPIFFRQMKNKFFTFSNSGKKKIRQYLVNKITLEKQKLNQDDPRIGKLQYFLDKMCKCTGTCQDTIDNKVFIGGGKRKTYRRRKGRKSKSQKKRRTRRRKH